MKKLPFFLVGFMLLFSSCTPRISTTISKKYSTLDYREEVIVFGLQDPLPVNSEELGEVKIGDSGFSINCQWEVVVDKAKLEARKVGGNAIKITDHIPPGVKGSSCHRIKARILKVEYPDNLPAVALADSALVNADYALLHVYRHGGSGILTYDLHLGDSAICTVSSTLKKTIKIKKEGLNTLWAKKEAKEELPIDIRFGHEYYIRCSVSKGVFVGHPKLELIDNPTGRADYQSVKLYEFDRRDLILLNDGREIECIVNSEDSDNVYFTLFGKDREIKTQLNKSQIKSIRINE